MTEKKLDTMVLVQVSDDPESDPKVDRKIVVLTGFSIHVDGEWWDVTKDKRASLDLGPEEPIGINLTLAPKARENMEKMMSRGKMKPSLTQDSSRSGRGPSISLPKQRYGGPMVAPQNMAVGPTNEVETPTSSRAARRRAAKLEKNT